MKFVWSDHCKLTFISIITILSTIQCKTQPQNYSNTSSRQLDSLLQDYAYRSLNNPITGTIYNATVPSNLTGIKLSVLRLRSGSLKLRGIKPYREFYIPSGVITLPYVKRVAFVYQNLDNLSSFYYPLSDYSYLTPVIGLLAYNAMNLSANNLNELDVIATKSPILVKFASVGKVENGVARKCVLFDLNGSYVIKDLASSNTCMTYGQGHFGIVASITMIPSGRKGKSSLIVWKIVAIVVCGIIGLVLMSFICVCMCRCRKNKKVKRMERRSEMSESLQVTRVGEAQAPVASGTRTQPTLEHEYVLQS